MADLATAAEEWRSARQAVDDAKAEVVASRERLNDKRTALNDAIVDAHQTGTRMRDLVKITGLSREWIRTVLRQNGIMAED